MSKKSKRKKQRFALLVLLILIVLLILLIKSISGNTRIEPEDTSKLVQNEVDEQEITVNDDKIVEIKVSPSVYKASSGEVIEESNFKMDVIYKSGKKEEVNDDILFSTNSDLLKVENNTITVLEEALTGDMEIVSVKYKDYNADVTIKVFNDLASNIDENGVITNSSAYDIIVNKSRNLSSAYIPDDLVPLEDIPTSLQNPEVNQLRKLAYDALKELFAKAKEEKSFDLYARSGYRSYNTQVSLYSAYVSSKGQESADKLSAKPGQSEHQTGLAMDITCPAMNYQLDDTFGETEEGKWVSENAHKFGFVIRYPKGKEDITGYQYEPWHLRYVGLSLAKEIYDSKLTLEEYFEQ
jgi:D-alanyl-D-alanine carboxypeptidase